VPARISRGRSTSAASAAARAGRAKRVTRAAPAGALITLTSDFGLHDPYVGIMKSRLFERAPGIPVVDLTHAITPFRPEEAGYWLYCCLSQFAAGTVHVAVVDPGVGSARAITVLQAARQLFVAPDNGLLGLVAGSDAHSRAYRVTDAALESLGLALHSATFHGRDVMAPLAAELASGRLRAEQVGPVHALARGLLQPAQEGSDGTLLGSVAVVDHYGNCLTTIPALAAAGRTHVRLQPQGAALRWVRTYEEARPGEGVALVNSASMLEIAARRSSAAALLNIRPGQLVYLSRS
jgi:S-adenosyl-L-methionine hydrolase (adenosine-forming)